jgi:hypothetical protein
MKIKKFEQFQKIDEALMQNLQDIWGKKEELDPELQLYFSESNGFPMIRHPLVYSIMHTPMQNAYVNAQLKQKQEACEKAIANKDWFRFINMHERPYRLQAFQECEYAMDDKQFWEELGSIWTDSENIWQNKSEWEDYLWSDRPDREYMMDENDREEFEKLPQTFTIYRGYTKGKNEDGFSYSLDKSKAEWFAARFGGSKKDVKTVVANKKDCLGYFNNRNEKEIIYLGK